MIRPLRKYHLAVWRFLAVLLPLVFIAAILVRPLGHSGVKFKYGDDTFSATIESKTDSTSVVTVTVLRPVKTPSCVAILSTPSRETVLGTLNRPGVYTFVVAKGEQDATLNLRDAIRQRSIMSIPLTEMTKNLK
jgi:hypothetical protein